jgi:hypothetical protein
VAARNDIHVPSLVADSLVVAPADSEHGLTDAERTQEAAELVGKLAGGAPA